MPRLPDGSPISGRRWRRARTAAFRMFGTDCWWCGHAGGFEGDHLVRLADGGDPYDPENVRPSHGSNYPCPVCISSTTRRARCCNQERNRTTRPQREAFAVDPSSI